MLWDRRTRQSHSRKQDVWDSFPIDETGSIPTSIWEEHFEQVLHQNFYKFTNLQLRKSSAKDVKDSGECSRRFRWMFKKILGNVSKDSEKCCQGFQVIFKRIPGNLQEDFWIHLCRVICIQKYLPRVVAKDRFSESFFKISRNVFLTESFSKKF